MRPFTTSSSSTYFDLLRGLSNLLAGNIQFYGFGFPSEATGQKAAPINPVLLEEASAYTYVNNDYGSFFASLVDTAQARTHLVISDGVQSDVDGARFGEIVAAIGNWLEGGGVFTLMAYRAPYRGTYYHEVPTTGTVQYACDNRPFYIFGFFPSLDAQKEALKILRSGSMAPAHVIRIGQASAAIVAQERAYAPVNKRRAPRILANFVKHGRTSARYDHVYSGRPTTPNKRVPLSYEVRFDSTAPWTNLPDREMETVRGSLQPSYTHWRIDTLEVDVDPPNVALTLTEKPRVFEARTIPVAGQPLRAHLVTPMLYQASQSRQRVASLLTIGLEPAGANALVPDAFSTRRDDRPSACSQTLNMKRTMGAILREHYVVGRALLILQWTTS
ncbi:hypothetical protein [Salisaeta longa]|uniref:hypothetical protein n=1 Tax=Salisaeta longa TaxID=503170 RepID=UPI0012FAD542|nr:hypothetical protein [Salisaeta longa]